MSSPFGTNNPGIGGLNELTASEEAVVQAMLPLGSAGQILAVAAGGTSVEWISASGTGDMNASTYDPASVAEQLVGLAATQTMTNKTLTSPTINTPTLVLKQGAAAAPTAEGDIQWDTDDNQIKVGDGAATKTFSDDAVVQARANHTGTQTMSTISDAGSLATQNSVNDGDWSGTDLAVANGGTGSSTASGARTNLGLVIGTNVQAYDAGLASIAGLTTAADRMIYTTASDTYAVTTITSFGRSLIDDADASAARTTLGLGSAATQASSAFESADATILKEADVDDTPVNGVTTAPVSSNWAYDHENDTTAHGATGANVGTTNTQTLSNKRIDPRVTTTASSSTPTPNVANEDEFVLTALAVNATFGSPTGTPVHGQKLIIRIEDNGTTRTLAYNAIYRAVGVTLPTATTANKIIYLGCVYNSTDTKWDVVAVAEEA